MIPIDKERHFSWLFIGSTIMLKFTPVIVVAIAAAGAIILKEVLDGKKNSKMEHALDILAGALGTISAILLSIWNF